MISKFIGRHEEITLLENEWNKPNARLIILYGRRRIGKTRLLFEFISDKSGIFYMAEDTSPQIQINRLKEKIAEFTEDSVLRTLTIDNWDQLFAYFSRNCQDERFFLVIDEFSYLIRSDKSIISTIQKYWDYTFSSSSMCLILSGPMPGVANDMVLLHESPLYERRSRDIKLKRLPFFNARDFFNLPLNISLEIYMVIGGIPEYLLKASEYKNYEEFTSKEFFNKYGYFYNEPFFLIYQEFKEPKTYLSIIYAIAKGSTRPGEIANSIGIETRRIYPYMENLMRLDLIKREVSILENEKKGRYFINDQIFDFWFNFIFEHKEQIEIDIFRPDTHKTSIYFNKLFTTFVKDELMHHLLPADYKIGRWWHKNEEIDIIAINEEENKIAFFECCWMELDVEGVKKLIIDLKRRSTLVMCEDNEYHKRHGIIAKKIEEKELLRKRGYLAFDLDDLEEFISMRNIQ